MHSPEYAGLWTRESIVAMTKEAMSGRSLVLSPGTLEDIYQEAENILRVEERCLPPLFGQGSAAVNGQRAAEVRVATVNAISARLVSFGRASKAQSFSEAISDRPVNVGASTGIRRSKLV